MSSDSEFKNYYVELQLRARADDIIYNISEKIFTQFQNQLHKGIKESEFIRFFLFNTIDSKHVALSLKEVEKVSFFSEPIHCTEEQSERKRLMHVYFRKQDKIYSTACPKVEDIAKISAQLQDGLDRNKPFLQFEDETHKVQFINFNEIQLIELLGEQISEAKRISKEIEIQNSLDENGNSEY